MKNILEFKDYIKFKSYIRESFMNHMFDDDPGVDFSEHWEKLPKEDEGYVYIQERLPEYKGERKPGIMDVFRADGGYYIAYIHGGDNGPGSWVDYTDYFNELFRSVPGSWAIDLVNDCPDDVWTLRLGYEIKERP